MKYLHPKNEKIYVRIMPGKPHIKWPAQRKLYVVHRINRKSIDKLGNHVFDKPPEAHIPLNDFIYIEKINGR